MNEIILVIDAEPVVRSVITKILERQGYSVQTTDDFKRALEMIKSCTPRLVMTNVNLPGISGHDAMRPLRDHCPDVPVLMVSGLPDDAAIREWLGEDGFEAFPTPFTANDLVSKVREVISHAGPKD